MKFRWNDTVVDTDSSRDRRAAVFLAANIMKICDQQVPRGLDVLPWFREAYAWLRTFDELPLDAIESYLGTLLRLRYVDSIELNVDGDDEDTELRKTIRSTVVTQLTEYDTNLVFGPASEIRLAPDPAAMVDRVIARLPAAAPVGQRARIGLTKAVAHVIAEIYPAVTTPASAPASAPAPAKRPHEPAPAAAATPSADPPSKRRRVDPAPSLAHVFRKGDNEEGYCGNFKRVRRWQVNNPVRGVIVQHVTRTFDVTLVQTGQPLAAAALDGYVTDPGSAVHGQVTQYWELWLVSADGEVSDGGDDTFGLCSIIPAAAQLWNTTRGVFTIAGTARFYPCASTPDQLGFQPGDDTSVAGGLPWSRTDPTEQLRAAGLTASGDPVRYTVRSRWDSSDGTTHPRSVDFAGVETSYDKESSESPMDEDSEDSDFEPDSESDDPLYSRIYRRGDSTPFAAITTD